MIWGYGAHADRREMLRTIAREVELTRSLTGRRILDPKVMEAMAKVPREEFVPEAMRDQAFEDHPLPIGEGQTISQPFMVALMTDLLKPQAVHTVLEIGTGSGYQAAILSLLVREVYSLEIIAPLAEQAARRLARLGYDNVSVRCADGYEGWAQHAPFDGIVVTAAAPYIPRPLIEQLKSGARLVIPVGQPFMPQQLLLLEKDAEGRTRTRDVLGVAFVPLTGGKALH